VTASATGTQYITQPTADAAGGQGEGGSFGFTSLKYGFALGVGSPLIPGMKYRVMWAETPVASALRGNITYASGTKQEIETHWYPPMGPRRKIFYTEFTASTWYQHLFCTAPAPKVGGASSSPYWEALFASVATAGRNLLPGGPGDEGLPAAPPPTRAADFTITWEYRGRCVQKSVGALVAPFVPDLGDPWYGHAGTGGIPGPSLQEQETFSNMVEPAFCLYPNRASYTRPLLENEANRVNS
jgi:hypothetical protein